MAIVAPEISEEFDLDLAQMGLILSVFTWGYAIVQIPVGYLGDRFGPRKVLSILMAFVSLSVSLTGAAINYAMLFVSRLFLGLSEAGAFPVASRGMQMWFHRSERGRIQGYTHFFSRFAVATTPLAAAPIVYFFGWRSVFFLAGFIGLLWIIVFLISYRNNPKDHPKVNEAELAIIKKDSEEIHNTSDRPKVPWRIILRSKNMLCICLGYGCFFFGTNFYLTWYPTYLREYRGLSLLELGILGSLPLLAGMAGDVVGGTLTDRILKKTGKPSYARKVVAAPGFALAAVFVIPAAMTDSVLLSMACLALSFFFLEFVIGPAWAVPMDVGGVYSGTVTGIMNMAGAFSASLTPIIYGYLFARDMWVAPFMVSAGVLFLGSLIWIFLIDPEQSVVKEKKYV